MNSLAILCLLIAQLFSALFCSYIFFNRNVSHRLYLNKSKQTLNLPITSIFLYLGSLGRQKISGVSERMFGERRGRSQVQKALNIVTVGKNVAIKVVWAITQYLHPLLTVPFSIR